MNKNHDFPAVDSLKKYIQEITQIPLLTIAEEKRCAKAIHGKNVKKRNAALETLITANLRLVVKIAHDFKGFGIPLTDLISDGNIGLMRAAERFDTEHDAKFSSYAAWWIRQAMYRGIAKSGKTVRIPIQTQNALAKLNHASAVLSAVLHRDPTAEELAAETGFSVKKVRTLMADRMSIVSLHAPITAGEDGNLEELIPDPNAQMPADILNETEKQAHLLESIRHLNQRERDVLLMRYFKKMTLEEISKIIGRTRERVRQIQNTAQKKLRTMMEENFVAIA